MKRLAFLVALMCGTALAGAPSTVTVNDMKFTVGQKLAYTEPVEFQDLCMYAGKHIGTGDDCIIVTGFLVSNLPQKFNYVIKVKIAFLDARRAETQPGVPAEVTITAPPAKKRVKFIAYSTGGPTGIDSYVVSYSLDRLTLNTAPKAKQ